MDDLMGNGPHVLLLPSWYPSSISPQNGTFFREQALALHEAGIRVGVVAPEVVGLRAHLTAGRPTSNILRSVEEGIPTFRKVTVPLLPRFSRRNAWAWLRAGRALVADYVREQGVPDLLHAHCVLHGGVLASEMAKRLDIPFVVTEHSSAFARGRVRRWAHRQAGRAFAAAAARLVVSSHLGTELTARFEDGFCPWQTMPNTLDRQFEAPLPDRQERPDGQFRILCVGTFRKLKAQDQLIKAFAKAFRGESGPRLGLAGHGATESQCRALAAELGIAPQVDFLGLLDREAVRRRLLATDVLVLPSYYETFGVVVIEAFASGVPVIAARCGGPEGMIDESNGLLVPPGDVDALSGALLRMRTDLGRYDPEDLRRNCLARYSRQAVADRLSALYRAILATNLHNTS